jgi:hypothetical protein
MSAFGLRNSGDKIVAGQPMGAATLFLHLSLQLTASNKVELDPQPIWLVSHCSSRRPRPHTLLEHILLLMEGRDFSVSFDCHLYGCKTIVLFVCHKNTRRNKFVLLRLRPSPRKTPIILTAVPTGRVQNRKQTRQQ